MKRRKWEARTKALVVLQGLKGRPVVDMGLLKNAL